MVILLQLLLTIVTNLNPLGVEIAAVKLLEYDMRYNNQKGNGKLIFT